MGFHQRKLHPSQHNLEDPPKPDDPPLPDSKVPDSAREVPKLEPPLPLPPHHDHQKHLVTTSMVVMTLIIGSALLFGIVCLVLRIYNYRRRNARRTRSVPIFFGTQEDFVDEDQGPAIDHPIWYINTIGLQQSLIDSITVIKYKKDEGLTEGTECSVCLNEFQEDESLRLLPKCTHAFHIPCIDTWLRAHKNCPLCRAPIVCDNFDVQVALSVAPTNDLRAREEPQMENSENNSGLISNQVGEDGASEVRNGDDSIPQLPIEDGTNTGNSKKSLDQSTLRNHSRVQSDLVDTRQALEAEMQPMRRSVSLDFSSALAIYNAVANAGTGKHQGNSDTRLVHPKYSKLKSVGKRESSGNLSFCKLMRSSSIGIGRSLQKGPISMKRSSSSSGKSSLSRPCRSQNPIHSF